MGLSHLAKHAELPRAHTRTNGEQNTFGYAILPDNHISTLESNFHVLRVRGSEELVPHYFHALCFRAQSRMQNVPLQELGLIEPPCVQWRSSSTRLNSRTISIVIDYVTKKSSTAAKGPSRIYLREFFFSLFPFLMFSETECLGPSARKQSLGCGLLTGKALWKRDMTVQRTPHKCHDSRQHASCWLALMIIWRLTAP